MDGTDLAEEAERVAEWTGKRSGNILTKTITNKGRRKMMQ